eukprot:c23023_g1_i1 orf=82-1077(+)
MSVMEKKMSSLSPFVEASLPQQKTVDDNGSPFPLVLLPASHLPLHSQALPHLLEGVRANKAWLEQQLYHHGAILFRGFGIQSAQDFDAFVEAFGWQELEYVGLAPRTHVWKRVYTANEAPPEAEIFFHHEMSRMGIFPSRLFFFCEIKPREGGQTPILLSHKVTERMQKEFPDFVKAVEESGLIYTHILSPKQDHSKIEGASWQDLFHTVDEAEAEKRAAQIGVRLEWLPDRNVKFIQGPYKSIRIFDERGRKTWFNNMTGYYSPGSDIVTLGDGSPLTGEPVSACVRIEHEEAVTIPWEEGDVMLLDNLAVMHGRRPCKPPRRVLVSMCK